MKRVSLRDTGRKAKRVSHHKLVTQPQITCHSLIILITESRRFVLGVNVMSQSDFSDKVKGQTKRGREMIKT